MDGLPLPRDEYDRLVFFESTREKAESDYLRSPHDAEVLTRWGGALLELAQFRQGQQSIDMVADAVSKFEEALRISPKRPDTLWCLGNAHTSQGFLVTETEKAKEYFKKASLCFQQAFDEEPHNELYQKSLEMSDKAPALHIELQKQLNAQAILGAPSGSTIGGTSKGSKKKKKKNSDFKYDVLGWIVLAVGVVVWAGMAKSSMQAAPPSNFR
eukprot:c23041_g1_i1 orf=338-976(-)